MLSVEVADRRLRGVRARPRILEAAFRLAIREAIFVRPGDFGDVLQRRAEFHAMRYLDGFSSSTDRAELLLTIENVTRRFSRSRLCARLLRVAVERIHAAELSSADLNVTGCARGSFAIRFVASPTCREQGVAINAPSTTPAHVEGLIVYDLRTAQIRRFDLTRGSSLLMRLDGARQHLHEGAASREFVFGGRPDVRPVLEAFGDDPLQIRCRHGADVHATVRPKGEPAEQGRATDQLDHPGNRFRVRCSAIPGQQLDEDRGRYRRVIVRPVRGPAASYAPR